jgi:putative transposase
MAGRGRLGRHVQACQDARRAYRNWFDSLSGARKGRRVGHPRFRTKHGRQSIRLTRNGFALHGTRRYVAKVGDLNVRWSRELPSTPSSVTVIREPDGRFYASFVVEREAIPLPGIDRTAGIDLGLCVFAAVASSDGAAETLANPWHLRAVERRLAKAQRALSRKRKGSANRAKARHRVAVAHRKVRDQRADHHHKLALRLIREHQAVAVEDLAVVGLARTRLAKSVHDAGWAMFVRLLEEKAAQHGRRVVRIGRWEPTSQTCSTCGHRDGPKPLKIRTWTCPACGARHDRDVNAARNILVAAGLAETLNAWCDTRSLLVSEEPPNREEASRGDSPGPVSRPRPRAHARRWQQQGVKLERSSPRVPWSSRGQQARGRLDGRTQVNPVESFVIGRLLDGKAGGSQGPGAERRQATPAVRRAGCGHRWSRSKRGRPPQSWLTGAERGNPLRSRRTDPSGKSTVRKT